MLCSAQELGLGEEADGIIELQHPVGADLAEIAGADLPLDDLTVDLDLTPNRGDCLSSGSCPRSWCSEQYGGGVSSNSACAGAKRSKFPGHA